MWQDGFTPLIDPVAVISGSSTQVMHTFTHEFFHPLDRVQQVSAAAASRFYSDDRRFPPGAYEEASLLWRGEEWRQPQPVERCQLMGVPFAAVAAATGDAPTRRRIQNSWVGNGFHIPSVVAILCFLPSLLAAKIPPPFSPASELELHERLVGTVWEPGRLDTFPGLLDAPSLVHEMQSMFHEFPIPQQVWETTQYNLSRCHLQQLQAYSAWSRMRGGDWEHLGPCHVDALARTRIFAGLSGQRYPSSSSRGLDHLLTPGLGKDQHMAESQLLPTPFAPTPWPEPDVSFVVDALFVWQTYLVSLSSKLRRILGAVAGALLPLELALDAHRCPSSKLVAASKKPGFMALLTALLRWPDRDQPSCIIQGYHIVGDLPSSGVFRPVDPGPEVDPQSWLGPVATQAVDTLLSSRPPRFAEDIFKVTCEEQERNFCGPFLTRAAMDATYGPGNWRPLERFIIEQADGKKRVIDNCRKTGRNGQTRLWETIWTVSIDCIASFARMVAERFNLDRPPLDSLPWMDLRIGTDDLPDAYRGLPVCDEHMAFSAVAIYVPDQGWRFSLLHGLAYGLESAVVHFNRLPQLGVAAARRLCLSFCAAYFDDELSVEFIRDYDVSQRGLALVFRLLGAPPQPQKAFTPASNRYYLGSSVHTGDFCCDGIVRFQPKSTTSHKVLTRLQEALKLNYMSRDAAGKLRGDLNWMYSNCAGQVGKFAGPVLTEIQHGIAGPLSPSMRQCLEILAFVVQAAEPRDIVVIGQPPPVMRIYSDASFENGELRLGWICFPPASSPVGGTCVVPPQVLEGWLPRRQQIYPGEAFCGVIVPWFHKELLRNCDLLWFIDNEAAASALIRGSSRPDDVHRISQLSHVLLHGLGCRAWIEWIDSDSNPSDGLSRLGLEDPWTLLQGWTLSEYTFPAELLPSTFLATFKSHIGMTDSG